MPNRVAEDVSIPPKPRSLVVPLALVLLITSLGGGYLYLSQTYPGIFKQTIQNIYNRAVSQTPQPTPTPPPTTPASPLPKPSVILPKGAQTYNFSHGDQVLGPKTSTLTLDPLSPNTGETQTITLKATHTSPITSVSVELITDNQTTPHTLTQKDGTNQDGTWSGSWKMSDTFQAKYGLRLILKSDDHDYDNTMWFK